MAPSQVDDLVKARDAICSGDRDFVFAKDGLGVVSWAYPDTVNRSKFNTRNYPDGKHPTPTVVGPFSQGLRT